jgi:hypothetical protein
MPYALNVKGLGEVEVPDDSSEIEMLQEVLLQKGRSGEDNPYLDTEQEFLQSVSTPLFPPIKHEPYVEPEPDRGYVGEIMAGLGSGFVGMLGSALSGTEEVFDTTEEDKKNKGALQIIGEHLEGIAADIKPTEGKEVTYQLAAGVGSIGGMIGAPLALTTGLGLAGVSAPVTATLGVLTAGAIAAGAGADEAYDRVQEHKAKGNKVTNDQVNDVTQRGWGIGWLEVAPWARAMSMFNKMKKVSQLESNALEGVDNAKAAATRAQAKKTGVFETAREEVRKRGEKARLNNTHAKHFGKDTNPFLREYAKDIAKQFGFEGAQEFSAALLQNAAERSVYNPDKELIGTESIHEGLYGGGAGAIFQGIIGTFAPRKSRVYRKKMKEFMDTAEYKQMSGDALKAAEDFENATDAETAEEARNRFDRTNDLLTRFIILLK